MHRAAEQLHGSVEASYVPSAQRLAGATVIARGLDRKSLAATLCLTAARGPRFLGRTSTAHLRTLPGSALANRAHESSKGSCGVAVSVEDDRRPACLRRRPSASAGSCHGYSSNAGCRLSMHSSGGRRRLQPTGESRLARRPPTRSGFRRGTVEVGHRNRANSTLRQCALHCPLTMARQRTPPTVDGAPRVTREAAILLAEHSTLSTSRRVSHCAGRRGTTSRNAVLSVSGDIRQCRVH